MTSNQKSEGTSTRPYLIRAWHEWCCDNGFTPYVTVLVDDSVQVPREYAKDGEIVLNIGFDATTALSMGNDYLEFKARFGGVVREIVVPVDQIVAIFARENGQGMAFPKVNRVERSEHPQEDGSRMPKSENVSSALDLAASSDNSGDQSGSSKVSDLMISKAHMKPSSGTKPTLIRIK